MQRFWDTVIGPILAAVRPEVVVEIGSDQGGNTENLLGFCRQTGATLHVIDPAPGYEVSEWQRKHGEHFVFHKDLSLNALPRIEAFDAVLIDGDHNWYTVYNELKTIERLRLEQSQEFPLIMLHDVGWPYGRRDLYYVPDTIPEEHRKPHAKKGMLPGVEGLLEEDGLNQHLHNAVFGDQPRSGVLTAVEDFLEETHQQLELIRLPGLHGLGILFPSQLQDRNVKLAAFLENLRFSSFVSRYVEAVEKDRLATQIREQRDKHTIDKERRKLREESQQLRETRQRLRQVKLDQAKLIRWLEELDDGISDLSRSRQWRVGGTLEGISRKVLPDLKVPTAMNHLKTILEQFRDWRKGRDPQADGSRTSSGERKDPLEPNAD